MICDTFGLKYFCLFKVYFNLGVLQVKIDELIGKKVAEVRGKMNELLDVQRIVAIANEPAPGTVLDYKKY